MAPSSNTPNFSRPLPSPLSTGALDTPVRGSQSRHALAELSHSASLMTMPYRTPTKDQSPSKRLFDLARVSPDTDKLAEITSKRASIAGSPKKLHNRKLSKVGLTSAAELSAADLRYAALQKLLSSYLTTGQC